MLKNIEVSNFRTFKHLEMSDLPRVCLISGQNSVGKSTLLETIFFFYCPRMDTMLGEAAQASRANFFSPNDFLPSLFHAYDTGNEAVLKFTDESSINTNIYTLGKKEMLAQLPKMTVQNFPAAPHNVFPGVATSSINELPPISSLIIKRASRSLNEGADIPPDKETTLVNYDKFPFSTPDGDVSLPNQTAVFLSAHESVPKDTFSVEEMFSKLQDEGRERVLIDTIKKIVPFILNIYISAKNNHPFLMCNVDGLPQAVPLSHMGDGVSRAFSIILQTLVNQPDILLVDEIENGIHYSVLKILWKAIFENARAHKCQIFLTTHSYECIEAAAKAYNELQAPAEENLFAFYRLEKRDNDSIVPVRYTPEDLDIVIDSNWEIR